MAFSYTAQPNTNNLFWPDEGRLEQCFAAHIVQGCQRWQQGCSQRQALSRHENIPCA